MKQFKEENINNIENKMAYLRRCLDSYNKYELASATIKDTSAVEKTLSQIKLLRKSKAGEIYSMLKKYGWPENISENAFNTMIEALEYGEKDTLLKILPYVKNAFQMGKLKEEDFYKILDTIRSNDKTILSNNIGRTLK